MEDLTLSLPGFWFEYVNIEMLNGIIMNRPSILFMRIGTSSVIGFPLK